MDCEEMSLEEVMRTCDHKETLFLQMFPAPEAPGEQVGPSARVPGDGRPIGHELEAGSRPLILQRNDSVEFIIRY